MAKPKIRFVCQSCGYVTAKWLGKCPECGQWDSFVEEMDVPERPGQSYLPVGETAKPKPLHQVCLGEGLFPAAWFCWAETRALASRLCFWMPA